MPFSAHNRMQAGFAAALFSLLFAALIAGRTTERARTYFQRVDETRAVLQTLDDLLLAAVNLETVTRGYLLTGDAASLDLFKPGVDQIHTSLNELRRPSATHRLQRVRLDQLEPLLTSKIEKLESLNAIRRREPGGNMPSLSSIDDDKSGMDEIRRQIAEMRATENQNLADRIKAAQIASRQAAGVLFAGSLLAVLLVGLAGQRLLRDSRLREQAERTASAARDYAESVVNAVHEPLLVLDGVLNVRSANRAFYQRFQLAPTQTAGRPWNALAGEASGKPSVSQSLDALLREGRPVDQFELAQEINGRGRAVFLVDAHRFEEPAQATKLILLAFEDITERQASLAKITALNADLLQRAGELEAANRELESFSYSVSHDLRAPVRHINGFVDLLRKSNGDALDDKGRRYLATIGDSAKQMGRLIDDLLAFSRMGRLEMQRARVDLNLLAENAIRSQQLEAQGRNIIWQQARLPVAHGDPALLSLVFENLVANAVKYSRPRDPARIEISSQDTAGEHVVMVRDNGVGFDMQYEAKLFGVFQRLHANTEFEGTGIGLANVRRIIARHGGRTWAQGRLGEGATFFFSLPKQNVQTS